MPNLLDYIKNIQYDSFYDQAINKLDILALTELSYLPLTILFRQNSPVLVFVLINYLMLSMKNTIKNFLLYHGHKEPLNSF